MIQRHTFTLFLLGLTVCATSCSSIEGAWENACKENTLSAYQEFLRGQGWPPNPFPLGHDAIYPHLCVHAWRRVQSMEWKLCQSSDTAEAYAHFIESNPGCQYLGDAQVKLGERLAEARAEQERVAWSEAKESDTYEGYCTFMSGHPQSQHVSMAGELADEALWRETAETGTYGDFEKYLNRFPQGKHANHALTEADDLLWEMTEDQKTLTALELYVDRFEKGRHAQTAAAAHEDALWDLAESSGNEISLYTYYLSRYPSAKNKSTAEDCLHWYRFERDGTEAGLRAYLGIHPEGRFASKARSYLERTEQAGESSQATAKAIAEAGSIILDTQFEFFRSTGSEIACTTSSPLKVVFTGQSSDRDKFIHSYRGQIASFHASSVASVTLGVTILGSSAIRELAGGSDQWVSTIGQKWQITSGEVSFSGTVTYGRTTVEFLGGGVSTASTPEEPRFSPGTRCRVVSGNSSATVYAFQKTSLGRISEYVTEFEGDRDELRQGVAELERGKWMLCLISEAVLEQFAGFSHMSPDARMISSRVLLKRLGSMRASEMLKDVRKESNCFEYMGSVCEDAEEFAAQGRWSELDQLVRMFQYPGRL